MTRPARGTEPIVAEVIQLLEVPLGFERSVKLSTNQVSGNRYIFCLATKSLRRPVADVLRVARVLGFPPSGEEKIVEPVERSIMVGFGCDGGDRGQVLKLYTEFPGSGNAAAHPLDRESVGFKWLYGTDVLHRTHYVPRRFQSYSSLLEWLHRGCVSEAQRAFFRAVVSKCKHRCNVTKLLALASSDDNTTRRAVDLKLAHAAFGVSELLPDLLRVLPSFSVGEREFRSALSGGERTRVTHLTGGSGHRGEPFLAAYFGLRGAPGQAHSGGAEWCA